MGKSGEDAIELAHQRQAGGGEKLRFTEAAGGDVAQGGERVDFAKVPGVELVVELTADEDSPGGRLRGEVGGVGEIEGGGGVPGDGLSEAERFVVEEAVDETAEETRGGFEEDQAAARSEDTSELGEGGAGKLEVMPDVEKDEVGDGGVGERKRVGVFLAIEPRVGKEVGGDAVGDDLLDIAHAGAEFDGEAGEVATEFGGEGAVEVEVDLPEERFAVPRAPIAEDLGVVPGGRNRGVGSHAAGKTLSDQRAAKSWSVPSPTCQLFMTNEELARHFDAVSETDAGARKVQAGFHAQVAEQLRALIPEGSRVLEAGCGRGTLLRALRPARGVGVDFSEKMLAQARAVDTAGMCEYRLEEACAVSVGETFDYVVLDFLVGYLPDVQACLERMRQVSEPRTRLCITSVNVVWTPVLGVAQWFGAVTRQPPSNWLSTGDLMNLLELSGWEVVHRSTEQVLPMRVPLLSGFFNRFLVRLPLLRHLGSSLYLVARPRVELERSKLTVSVIVPARNESGNIRAALERIPVMGAGTEVIFVEGNSKDDTWATIQREVAAYRGPLKVRAMQQPGRGKWDAVRTGFAAATGDVLVIQDADLTAPPEDLPKFFAAIASGAAEFANGSRLVYPMEKQAMRFLNLIGNKFFALALSFVLGQSIKDSLCGTKMLLRKDYERILKRIEELGDFDPFGDFNLLFGAALLKLRIRDVPVRYKDRTYGETNISRFRHGWLLLKMTAFGLLKLKFGRG